MTIAQATGDRADARLVLLCRASSWMCALPVSSVEETMRPLPVVPLSGAPPFVLGVSVIRAMPVPVVDAARLLGGVAERAPTRFVTLRVGERRVALAVHAVDGIVALAAASIGEMPPLLSHAGPDFVDAIGTLDRALLVVLESVHLVPESVWAATTTPGGRA